MMSRDKLKHHVRRQIYLVARHYTMTAKQIDAGKDVFVCSKCNRICFHGISVDYNTLSSSIFPSTGR